MITASPRWKNSWTAKRGAKFPWPHARKDGRSTMSIRIMLAAIVLLGSTAAVFADKDRKATHRHSHITARAQPAVPLAGSAGGRLVTHPAWTFACEAAYGPNRGLPCD